MMWVMMRIIGSAAVSALGWEGDGQVLGARVGKAAFPGMFIRPAAVDASSDVRMGGNAPEKRSFLELLHIGRNLLDLKST